MIFDQAATSWGKMHACDVLLPVGYTLHLESEAEALLNSQPNSEVHG